MTDEKYIDTTQDPPVRYHTDPDCRKFPENVEIAEDTRVMTECQYCKYGEPLSRKLKRLGPLDVHDGE
jgi:hypothetical protein